MANGSLGVGPIATVSTCSSVRLSLCSCRFCVVYTRHMLAMDVSGWSFVDVAQWAQETVSSRFATQVAQRPELVTSLKDSIFQNLIDGPLLVELSDSDWRELVPCLGPRKVLMQQLRTQVVHSVVLLYVLVRCMTQFNFRLILPGDPKRACILLTGKSYKRIKWEAQVGGSLEGMNSANVVIRLFSGTLLDILQ